MKQVATLSVNVTRENEMCELLSLWLHFLNWMDEIEWANIIWWDVMCVMYWSWSLLSFNFFFLYFFLRPLPVLTNSISLISINNSEQRESRGISLLTRCVLPLFFVCLLLLMLLKSGTLRKIVFLASTTLDGWVFGMSYHIRYTYIWGVLWKSLTYDMCAILKRSGEVATANRTKITTFERGVWWRI